MNLCIQAFSQIDPAEADTFAEGVRGIGEAMDRANAYLHTVIGSFGLVTVAPFTALCAGLFLARRGGHPQPQEEADG